jgi:biopolymer transport protein ExbD
MPLIDVIFLLLTFSIYAMVLMVRAELVPMQLQEYVTGERATPSPAVTISITLDGTVHVDREPVAMEAVLGRIEAARAEDPDTVVYLAMEDGQGSTDRGPILTGLWDRLQAAGLDIKLVGRPKD